MSEENGIVLSAERKELSTQTLISTTDILYNSGDIKAFSSESKIREFGNKVLF